MSTNDVPSRAQEIMLKLLNLIDKSRGRASAQSSAGAVMPADDAPSFCRHCGDAFHGPVRDCPSPDAGKHPYADSGRGGHLFDPLPIGPRVPLSPDRMAEIRALSTLPMTTRASITRSAVVDALADLLALYDDLTAECKRLVRVGMTNARHGGEPMFTREQIDRMFAP